jgi:DNA-binding NtrC family response regulator
MKYKILIIEDETETSKYLSLALTDEGFEVECAENGIVGIEKLRKSSFDLIVLDLKMPEKSGDEVLKEIREIDPYVQVVIYTNYSDAPVMQKLINMGVEGFIRKGATADLYETVEFIKSKLYPIDDDQRKAVLNKLFQQIKKTDDNEVFA